MDSRIDTLFAQATRPLLSYEFFPPKSDAGIDTLQTTIGALKETQPDFVTITYGAGGSTQARSLQVARMLQEAQLGPVMPHLTCVGSRREALAELVDEFFGLGFRNIMTLRGDPPQGETTFTPPEGGLKNARELVAFIQNQQAEICCGVAGYPETHPEATSREDEIAYLKTKVDAGAGFITTQLFFDNTHYYRFVNDCRAAGITVPILPGLLPVSSLNQVQRFTQLCGATLPAALLEALQAVGGEGEAAEEVGIRWCADQIRDLLTHHTPGIHLYILNRARAATSQELARAFGEASG